MDSSQFRPSVNVEDQRNDPWSPLYKAYGLMGMTATPTQTWNSMVESLSHPFTPNSAPPLDMTPSPDGSLQQQAGRDDYLKILKALMDK